MNAIVTIATNTYGPLIPVWYERVKKLSGMPVYLISADNLDETIQGINYIKASPGNPFPVGTPDYACAEKLRVFEHLPKAVDGVLFIDLDVMVLNLFWDDDNFEKAKKGLVICTDRFIGYKEKMEEEFLPFDPDFKMKFFEDGRYFYFNTGVFFANRYAHETHFANCLKTWKRYVDKTGRYPSIFDQNMVNYYIISHGLMVFEMPAQNNCLRQYPYEIRDGKIYLEGKIVNAFHFNGGDAKKKLERWRLLSEGKPV